MSELSRYDMDREFHIRALVMLMTKSGVPSDEIIEYLEAREYGLALQALAFEVMNG